MCNYSNKCKYTCGRLVCAGSVIVLLMGVVCAVLGGLQMGLIATPD